MSDASNIKEIIEKVEKSINQLTEQMHETRQAIEQLSEDLTRQVEQAQNQTKSMVQEVQREIATFQEQRGLVEDQLTSEVERAKQLSGLKNLEDALKVVREIVEEIGHKIDLEALIDTVAKFEAEHKNRG